MICPYCKQQIQDGSKACPMCGTSFVNGNTYSNAYSFNQFTIKESIQQQAAKQELNNIKTSDIVISFILMIAGICGIIYGFVSKSANALLYFIISILVVIIFGSDYLNKLNTKKRMEQLLDNKKRAYICPNCKSPNIKQKFVKGSTVRGKSRTRVSKNINPFHPFTYRNYDTNPIKTNYNYNTIYTCQNCGAVFDRPQVFEYE